jgi:hypothetical protein
LWRGEFIGVANQPFIEARSPRLLVVGNSLSAC